LPEHLGGQGGRLIDVACVLESAGKALLPGPLLPTVAAGAVALLADPTPTAQSLIRDLAAGVTAAVVLPDEGWFCARPDGGRWLVSGVSEVTAGLCSARTRADSHRPSYQHGLGPRRTARRSCQRGLRGRAAEHALHHAGLRCDDVDVLELYDPFSFEIIRQLEALGFCPEGEGGPFVADGHIAIDGSHPVTTDGGTMSFSHAGSNPQMMQRAIRAVQQLRGQAGNLQISDAHIALFSNGGAGALFTTVLILGDEPR